MVAVVAAAAVCLYSMSGKRCFISVEISVAAVVTAAMTLLISVSKEADPHDHWLVEGVAVGAAIQYGLKLYEIDV